MNRLKSAEKQYVDAFQDELKGFIKRVRARAIAKIDEATRAAEEVSFIIIACVKLKPREMIEQLMWNLRSENITAIWCLELGQRPRLLYSIGPLGGSQIMHPIRLNMLTALSSEY